MISKGEKGEKSYSGHKPYLFNLVVERMYCTNADNAMSSIDSGESQLIMLVPTSVYIISIRILPQFLINLVKSGP